jgi:hypothetical protein
MDESCCSSSCCKRTLPLLLAVLIAGGLFVVGKYVEVRGYTHTTISVEAEGKVMAQPDIALLQFGVQTDRQKTAQAVMEILAKRMTAILDAVKATGVEAKDINTQSLWLNPAYDYKDGQRVDQGFEGGQNLSVKVRDLKKIGDVLNAAVSKGANQAGSVSFTMDDPEVLRKQAREMAITKAQEKAKVLAAQLGRSLGKLQGFNEGSVGYPVNYDRAEKTLMVNSVGAGAPAPVVPTGDQEVSVTVTLTYELN